MLAVCCCQRRCVKIAFHGADTDNDILADILERIVARMSVSVSASWNCSFIVLSHFSHQETSNKERMFVYSLLFIRYSTSAVGPL